MSARSDGPSIPKRQAGSRAVGRVLRALAAGLLAAIPVRAAADPLPALSGTTLAAETVRAFDALFAGPHAGMRAVHAKGVLVEGTFAPSREASAISRAPHLQREATSVLVRFSNFPGTPGNADGDALGSPRGMAIKFLLPDEGETDIVAHSYDGFPAATPAGFLEFLRTVGANDGARLAALAAREPAVRAFLDAPKPAPASYGTQSYFGVNAFLFTNAAGTARFGRYRIEPVAGESHLDAAEAAARPAGYLAAELAGRLALGPVRFRLALQLAQGGDDVADGSRPWPRTRPSVTLGTLSLTRIVEDPERQRRILFTPLSLVPGIAASADPMLDARTRTYRVSHERRAPEAGGVIADALGAAR